MAVWANQPSVKGSSETIRMVLLTVISVGITFTWGVELTYGTPYLLSLGLTKGQTSAVWVAGPLSGLLVQPIMGAISDQSRSQWGRRRPVICLGSIIVTCSLLMLGFTKELVRQFIADEQAAKTPVIAITVLALYVTDFSINAVMSCSRSLLVDTLPAHKQQAGAAWANRMGSIGHIAGYGMGAVDLVGLFGTTLGDTQFKQLTVIAAAGMLVTSSLTCWAVTERILPAREDHHASQSLLKVVRQIWSTLLNLPPRVQAICWAVFWSWIGWFPFIVYSSTWIGETYFRYDVPPDAKQSEDAMGQMGRVGSMALTVYSSITFLGAWVLPLLVKAPDERKERFTPRPPASIAPLVGRLSKLKPDLLTVWMSGHLLFSAAMSLAPFAASFRFATVLVAVCGLPWTICHWAPTAFLGIEVNKLRGGGGGDDGLELLPRARGDGDADGRDGELSGIYFGILNIYTTIPQFLGTMLSALVFAALDPGRSPELSAADGAAPAADGPNAIAVCLFVGAICTLGAAYATRRLRYVV